MNPNARRTAPFFAALLAVAVAPLLRAGENTAATTAASTTDIGTRYGLFGLLDHRSSYGTDLYPEPFLVDESDLDNELRFDWFHAKAGSARSDLARAEIEKSFGLVTIELEAPYERNASPDGVEQGMGNVSIGARCPFFQYVSPGGWIDTTFGAAVELGIPTTSAVSKNTELVPKIFNDLRFGSHITLQSVFGYSAQFGPGENSGLHLFEYGFVLGIILQHKELPLPGVQQFIPVFEIKGEKQLNHDGAGQNNVLATAGFRVNLKAVGPFQPRLGVGYVFPLNDVARQDVHHGIYTSLAFDF